MKKNLSFMVLLGIAAMLMVSCNKSDNRAMYMFWGSQEADNSLIGHDGTEFVPVEGKDKVLRIPDGLERSRIRVTYYTSKDQTKALGDKGNIDIQWFEQLATQGYAWKGSTAKDDPILVPSLDLDFNEYTPVTSLEPGISTFLNYLDMMIWHFKYKGNASTGNTYATVSMALEVDPDIVPGIRPGEKGEMRDTINMSLKFNSNRKEDETLKDSYAPFPIWRSFDISRVPEVFEFPLEDQSGKAITYVIKMRYKTFENLNNIKEDEIAEKYLTTEWTPGDPYYKWEKE